MLFNWLKPQKAGNSSQEDVPIEPTRVEINGTEVTESKLNELSRLEEHMSLQEAAAAWQSILDEEPKNALAHYKLGCFRHMKGAFNEAISFLEEALSLNPDLVDAYYHLSLSYAALNDLETATDHIELFLHYHPDSAVGHFQAALLSKRMGKNDSALSSLVEAINLKPDFGAAYSQLGQIYHDLKRYDDAAIAYQKALESTPESADLLNNLGHALLSQDRYGESIPPLIKAVKLNPGSLVPRINLGCSYRHLGEFDKALEQFEYILQREPNNFEARWYRSHVWLALRNWDQGWNDYTCRFQSDATEYRAIPFAPWRGESLAGKTLLVFAEQGIGDEIMFASCLPDVLEQAGHCVIECTRRLYPLFKRSFPNATVFESNQEHIPPWLKSAPHIDYQIPIGGLPYFFRRSDDSFHKHHGYLNCDPQKTSYWKEVLEKLGNKPKIGISWRGGTAKTRIHARSIPLVEWLPILRAIDADFISLQYGRCQEEIETVQQQLGVSIQHWQSAVDDFDEAAALIQSLDLVISVCTAVVHLSGAIGKRVLVLAPAVPEWRYLQSGDVIPWYPSSTVYRQQTPDIWHSEIEQVAKDIRTMFP